VSLKTTPDQWVHLLPQLIVPRLIKEAIDTVPEAAWTVAIDAAGEPRRIAQSGLQVVSVAELTGCPVSPPRAGWRVCRSWSAGNARIRAQL
jgi:hypothetical protein